MKIIIGADPAGFPLKTEIKDHLLKHGYEVVDVGMHDSKKEVTYYDAAAMVARKIQAGEAEKGILFCGTGMGVSIVANKFKGIYASVVESEFTGERCKIINDANVLCLGCWIVSPYRAKQIVDLWLGAEFTKGKKELDKIAGFLKDALKEIKKIEAANMR
jgi:ribose 5-phosphate isomerase B